MFKRYAIEVSTGLIPEMSPVESHGMGDAPDNKWLYIDADSPGEALETAQQNGYIPDYRAVEMGKKSYTIVKTLGVYAYDEDHARELYDSGLAICTDSVITEDC